LRVKKDDTPTIIDLGDGYFLRESTHDFILTKNVVRTKRDSTETYEGEEVIGYYGDFEAFSIKMLTLRLHNLGYKNKTQWLDAVQDARDYVKDLVEKYESRNS